MFSSVWLLSSYSIYFVLFEYDVEKIIVFYWLYVLWGVLDYVLVSVVCVIFDLKWFDVVVWMVKWI